MVVTVTRKLALVHFSSLISSDIYMFDPSTQLLEQCGRTSTWWFVAPLLKSGYIVKQSNPQKAKHPS